MVVHVLAKGNHYHVKERRFFPDAAHINIK
jgi:hypothetical protein